MVSNIFKKNIIKITKKKRQQKYKTRKTIKKQSKRSKKNTTRRTVQSHDNSNSMDISRSFEPDQLSPYIPMEIDEEYIKKPFTLDLTAKRIIISIVIMGHGGIKNQFPIDTFKSPPYLRKLDILGMRYAGINNLVNREYELMNEEFLANVKNSKTIELLDKLNRTFSEYVKEKFPEHGEIRDRLDLINKRFNIHNDYFGIKENYNSRRAQKFYQGVTEKEIIHKSRHPNITKMGPYVKIYSVLKDGVELLSKGETILVDNVFQNMTLTDIIQSSKEKIFTMDRFLTSDEKTEYENRKFVEFGVVDLTCNFTKEYPNIEFIGKN